MIKTCMLIDSYVTSAISGPREEKESGDRGGLRVQPLAQPLTSHFLSQAIYLLI